MSLGTYANAADNAYRETKLLNIAEIEYEGSDPEPNCVKSLDPRRVRRLVEQFRLEGCHPETHPVTVLRHEHRYICLNGKHRLEAGKTFLPGRDQKWLTYVYRSKLILDNHHLPHLMTSKPTIQMSFNGSAKGTTGLYRIATAISIVISDSVRC